MQRLCGVPLPALGSFQGGVQGQRLQPPRRQHRGRERVAEHRELVGLPALRAVSELVDMKRFMHDQRRQFVRVVGYQHIFAVAHMHAFHCNAGGDDRQAVTHRHIHLALDAGAITQRRDRQTTTVHVWRDVGQKSVHDHAIGLQLQDLRWRLAADHMELHVR